MIAKAETSASNGLASAGVSTDGGFSLAREALAGILLAAAALWLRVHAALPTVFPDPSTVQLLGVDAYDHLRKAGQLAELLPASATPRPLRSGDWVNPGLYDEVVALPARLGVGSGSLEELAAWAAWLPPLLGALSVILVVALARQFLPPVDAWLAGWLYLLFPGESLDRTTLGFADHHAAEIVATLLMLWAVVRYLRTGSVAKPWLGAAAAALPTIALLLLWRGSPLTLTLLALSLAATVLLEVARHGDYPALLRRTNAYAVSLAALWLLVSLALPRLLLGPLATQRGWVAVVALLLVAPLGRLAGWLRRQALAAFAALLAVLAGLAVAVVASPWGAQGLRPITSPRLSTVLEHRDLSPGDLLFMLGWVAILAAPGLLLAVLAVLRRRMDSLVLVPVVVAGAWAAIWWRTHDVGYLVPALLALPAALPLARAREWLASEADARRVPSLRLRKALALVPLVVLTLAPIWPYDLVAAPGVSSARAEAQVVYTRDLRDAADWLRRAPAGDEKSAVASPWVLGNLVASLGGHRPVWSRMPTRSAARWLTAQDEITALALLHEVEASESVRWVLIDGRSCGSYFIAEARNAGLALGLDRAADGRPLPPLGPRYQRSLGPRLCFSDGSDLSRHRLAWESEGRVVTSHRLEPIDDDNPGASRVGLYTRPLDEGEMAPSGPQRVSLDGRDALLYGHRVHAAARIFEIVEDARGGLVRDP